MATNRDKSELTFEGMTARVGRFLSRVYRFPHDWGVPEPKTTDDGDAFLRKRLEELRIYGCSPVPDWMRRKRDASLSSARPNDLDPPPAPPFQGLPTERNRMRNRFPEGEQTETASPTVQQVFSPLKKESGPKDRGGSCALGSPLPHEQIRINSRPRLFRYDAKRLKRLIASTEHMIRCLIIWRAYRAMRDEDIKPRYHFIPSRMLDCCSSASGSGQSAPSQCSCARCTPKSAPSPPHPNFAVRGVPIYEPKASPFRISLPLEVSPQIPAKAGIHACEFKAGSVLALRHGLQPTLGSAARGRKLRNDDLSTHERLYLRLERLDQLYEQIDRRGRRLAARWAGEIYGPEANAPHPTSDREGAGDPSRRRGNITEQTSRHASEPDRATGESPPAALSPFYANPGSQEQVKGSQARQRIGARSNIRPLKSHDPPPDLLETTDEEEAEDLHILHDAAIRAAEEFPSLCG